MYSAQFGKTTTLSADMSIGETTSATLSSATFTNFTSDYLVLDYDNPSKREVIKCTVTGTAISNITRGQDGTSAIAHSSGAKVGWNLVPGHINLLFNEAKDGWTEFGHTLTYASATSFTVAADITDQIAVGDKIKVTNGGSTKYFYVTAVSYSSPNTTVTITGGSDYTLANSAITSPYFSKASSPVGFPVNSKTFSPLGVSYAERTTDYSATPGANTWSDITNLAVTVSPGGRALKITVFAPSMKCASSAGDTMSIGIREGSTLLNKSQIQVHTSSYNMPCQCVAYVNAPSAGTHTYKASIQTSSTSSVQTENVSATSPSFILVETI